MEKLIKYLYEVLLLFSLAIVMLVFVFSKNPTKERVSFKDGDIIFQTSQSKQCTAVQLATHSIYSHCGIIFIENGKTMVYEAVQPVKFTPFNEWIKRGKDFKYVVKRFKYSSDSLNADVIKKMKKVASKYLNKNYDIYFGWSDDLIYCSEYVWKIYKQGAGIEVGKLKKLKDFDLTSNAVKQIMRERYGNNVPYNETVVSPQDIFDSDNLVLVE